MNKILFALLIITFSCSKKDVDPTFCYKCTVTETEKFEPADPLFPNSSTTVDVEQCRLTKSAASEVEELMNHSDTFASIYN